MSLSLSGEYWQVGRRLHLNVGSASQRKLWAYDDIFQTNSKNDFVSLPADN